MGFVPEKNDKVSSLDSASGKDLPLPKPEACHGDAAESQLFEFDSQALTQLAVGSAIFIAFILALTDVIPLLPNAKSVISLAIKVVGDWIVVAVIWFLGFLGITQCLRLISRGVSLTGQGIKLSRFDRTVPWSSVEAVALEPNPFFSRLFSLPTPARRITLLFHFEVKNKFFSKLLFPNYIASFFFKPDTFDRLFKEILLRTALLTAEAIPQPLPEGFAVLCVRPENMAHVKSSYSWLKKQQVIVTVVVALSLFNFLGRKALGYYCFNSAGKAFSQTNFELARDYYRWSLKWDPTFAYGWNGLGQAEFRLSESTASGGDFSAAERDWRRAIFFKPDFVEPRLNIARLCIYRRDFEEAKRLVDYALGFAPLNELALIERAELKLRAGLIAEAEKDCRVVLSNCAGAGQLLLRQSKEYSFKAKCLLAQAHLLRGDTEGAMSEIEKFLPEVALYHDGEDFTSLLVLRAKILLACGRAKDAVPEIEMALRRHPFNEEVLTVAAHVLIEAGDLERASFILNRAARSGIKDPWIEILRGELAVARTMPLEALLHYQKATLYPVAHQDFEALSYLTAKLQPIVASGAQPLAEQALASCRRLKAALAK